MRYIALLHVYLAACSDTLILIFYAYEVMLYTDIKGYEIIYAHYAWLHGYNMEQNVET